jgi:hypothetical protein
LVRIGSRKTMRRISLLLAMISNRSGGGEVRAIFGLPNLSFLREENHVIKYDTT